MLRECATGVNPREVDAGSNYEGKDSGIKETSTVLLNSVDVNKQNSFYPSRFYSSFAANT